MYQASMTPERQKLAASDESPQAERVSTAPDEAESSDTNDAPIGTGKKLMIVAGDVSADKHLGKMIARMKEKAPGLEIWAGLGGEHMLEQGLELMYDLRDMNVIGLFENLKYLNRYKKIKEHIIKTVLERRPDVLLLVDYGAFNLRVARELRKVLPELKIVYFISPQIWASRPWRIKTVVDNISKMLVIFPFEETLYKSHGMNAKFVGHPLTQIPHESELMSRDEFAKSHGLDPAKPIVAVLPGSRKQEIREHLSMCITAIKEFLREKPDTQFVISKAHSDLNKLFDGILKSNKLDGLLGKNLVIMDGKETYNLLKNSDVVWAKSGTTTLEVAWFGKPMLVIYRGSWVTYTVIVIMKTIRNVSLPNILAGRTLVPELLQLDCRPQQLVRYTRDLLDVPGLRKEFSAELLELRRELGHLDYITTGTDEILESLGIEGN